MFKPTQNHDARRRPQKHTSQAKVCLNTVMHKRVLQKTLQIAKFPKALARQALDKYIIILS